MVDKIKKSLPPGKNVIITNKTMGKEKFLSGDRRYHYDFKCKKCNERNVGFMKTAFRGGIVEKGFGFNCEFCGTENDIDLTVRYYKTVEIEIDQKMWEALLTRQKP